MHVKILPTNSGDDDDDGGEISNAGSSFYRSLIHSIQRRAHIFSMCWTLAIENFCLMKVKLNGKNQKNKPNYAV